MIVTTMNWMRFAKTKQILTAGRQREAVVREGDTLGSNISPPRDIITLCYPLQILCTLRLSRLP